MKQARNYSEFPVWQSPWPHLHMPYFMMHQHPLPLLMPDHSTGGMFLEKILQKRTTGEEEILSVTGFLPALTSDYQKRSLFN